MIEAMNARHGETRHRWERAIADPAFDSLRQAVVLETRAEQMLRVLKIGTISTNMFLRRIHNFAVDMGWLPWLILRKNQWPAVRQGNGAAPLPKNISGSWKLSGCLSVALTPTPLASGRITVGHGSVESLRALLRQVRWPCCRAGGTRRLDRYLTDP